MYSVKIWCAVDKELNLSTFKLYNLYEGRYSPKGADGKRISRNVYDKTEEECERLLAEMIVEMKAEIKAEKEKLKVQQSA